METVRDQERWSLPKLIYAILMSILLISYLVIQAFDHEAFPMPTILAIPMILIALIGIGQGRLWKDKGFLLMISLLIIQVLRVVIKGRGFLFSEAVSGSLINGIWIIAGCYALGRILSVRQLKIFLHIVVAVWILGTVIQCLIALYGAWIDHEVLNLSGGSSWGIPYAYWQEYIAERLHVGYVYPTVAGSTLSLSGVLAFAAILAVRRKWEKILFGLAYLVIIITLGLTDARTSFLSLSAGVGVLVFMSILWLMGRQQLEAQQKEKIRQREIMKWIAAFTCMLVAFSISVIVVLKIAPAFNEVKTKRGVIVSSACAEEEENEGWKRKVQSRGFEGSNVLNGRDTVWKEVIQYSTEDIKRSLFGESIFEPTAGLNQRLQSPMGHCHNMFLQILLESGIMGLIPVLLFSLYTARNVFQVIKSNTLPLWIKLLPAFLVSVLVGDLAECFGWFYEWKIPALSFLYISCGIINVVGSREAKQAGNNNNYIEGEKKTKRGLGISTRYSSAEN